MSQKPSVLVAMSGGIDSSLAAMLLQEQGYQIIGITMKTWNYTSSGGTKKETGCCSLDSINDARNVAVNLNFPHYVLDIQKEFSNHVIDYFTNEYLNGRTPNPCILCNTHIKWEALLRRADALKCNYIATGHYAKIRKENKRYIISEGEDKDKDQSYALWGISQKNLSRSIFPLGDIKKSEVRKLVVQKGFNELVRKSESYEICFIPDNDYRSFLKRRVTDLEEKVEGGNFVLEKTGQVIGKHRGYPFYTIGQRRGLGIALGYPVYVTSIQKETNTVILGSEKNLAKKHMLVKKLNFIKYANIPSNPFQAIIKIRYNDKGTPATLEVRAKEEILVKFHKPVAAITPGQAAVFYENKDVIGGGWIKQSF